MISVNDYRTTLALVATCIIATSFGCAPKTDQRSIQPDENAALREIIEHHRQDALVSVTLDNEGEGATVPCSIAEDWDSLHPDEPGREFENGVLRESVISFDYKPDIVSGRISYLIVPEAVRPYVGRGGPLHLWVVPWGGTVDLACVDAAAPDSVFWVVMGDFPDYIGSISIAKARIASGANLAEHGLRTATDTHLSFETVSLPPGPIEEKQTARGGDEG